MSLNVFLELVEIKAKTASILPMLLGVCLSVYYYHSLNLMNSVLFFIAMLLFNMAVDMMDNYNDYNHAIDTVDYKKNTNIIGRENISPRLVLGLLLTFSVVAGLIGIYLVTRVGLPLLWMGIFVLRSAFFTLLVRSLCQGCQLVNLPRDLQWGS